MVIGRSNSNPLLDTREYEVEMPDGSVETYTANVIAENLYAQIDDDGNPYTIMEEIQDHRKDGDALSVEDGHYLTATGQKRLKRTTKGWRFHVLWKDGSSEWIRLADMKESYPVETAEYASDRGLLQEPAFAWWAPFVLRKRDRIICKVKILRSK